MNEKNLCFPLGVHFYTELVFSYCVIKSTTLIIFVC